MFIAKMDVVQISTYTNSYKNVHAGNESIDGRMTACDDGIGRRTTMQQPANKQQRGGGGSGSGGSAAAARQ